MRRDSILVTGGCGFIGSNLVKLLVKKYPEYKIINLDALTYAGELGNVRSVENEPNYQFVHGDICDRGLIERIFHHYDIKGVFHLAAESHVDNSIEGPEVFVKTNVNGTFTLLDVAYKSWMEGPFEMKPAYKNARFLHVSTDEVYGSLGDSGLFTEASPYAPNSPYSASKASSDMLVRSYYHTYGMPTVITNCSNNYGPNQNNEKLIPTIIRKAIAGDQIPIYGDGKNVRDWLYVEDHCTGLDLAYHKGELGEVYNIGGNNEQNNNYICARICELLDELKPKEKGSYADQVSFVKDRAGHDFRYAIDATKIEKNLGWEAQENFDSGIVKTVEWYLEKWNSELGTGN